MAPKHNDRMDVDSDSDISIDLEHNNKTKAKGKAKAVDRRKQDKGKGKAKDTVPYFIELNASILSYILHSSKHIHGRHHSLALGKPYRRMKLALCRHLLKIFWQEAEEEGN